MTRDEVLARVQAAGIRSVRFLYCDNANVVRGKAAYAGRWPTASTEQEVAAYFRRY